MAQVNWRKQLAKLLYNGDLEVSSILREQARAHAARVISFGEKPGNHHRVSDIRVQDNCTVARGRAWRFPLLYKVMVPGRHFAVNAIGVLAVVHALRCDRALAIASLGQWQAGAGRGAREVIQLDPVDPRLTVELIDDAYNSNPASLGASLEVLAAARPRDGVGRVNRGRRIAYLGDMKELGETEAERHAAVARLSSTKKIDVVHCIGPLMRNLWLALPETRRGRWAEDAGELAAGTARDLDAGDVVLVKGSLSMGLARVVDAIRKMGQAPAEEE